MNKWIELYMQEHDLKPNEYLGYVLKRLKTNIISMKLVSFTD